MNTYNTKEPTFETMRSLIASARNANVEMLEGVRQIDDVIDDVPNEAKQVCGEILINLSNQREWLDRLDEIAEQLVRTSNPFQDGNTTIARYSSDTGKWYIE